LSRLFIWDVGREASVDVAKVKHGDVALYESVCRHLFVAESSPSTIYCGSSLIGEEGKPEQVTTISASAEENFSILSESR
jgi:hypothetical protein